MTNIYIDCTVIGDVFSDLLVHSEGLRNPLSYGGTSYSDFVKMDFGGSGNIAVGLSLLGGRAAFVGKAGNDLFGKLYIKNLKEKEVISKVFIEKNSPTGWVIAFIDDRKERSFLVCRGANDTLSLDDVRKATYLIKKSKYVYISGYSLVNDSQRNSILLGIELARKYKKKIVFDPGAYNIVRLNPGLFNSIISLCDIFLPNLDEAMAVTNTENLEDIIDRLRNKVPLTALKCGEDGSILITEKECLKITGFKVRCKDSTGAGDAFASAFLYGLSKDLLLEATGRLASWFSAQVTTDFGSRNYPTKLRINSYLNLLNVK